MGKQQLEVNGIAVHFVEKLVLTKDPTSVKLTDKRYFMSGCWGSKN